ncbi:hypothetical protein ACFV4M_26900 [Kitasatospora indigofera]|uniref:hypothetical protein n=1 Tax=Kitasatospora indigofera TaxID=67307 RepID=UPI00364CB244
MPDRINPGAATGADFGQVRGERAAQDVSCLQRDLTALREDWNLRFTLRVALTDVRITTALDEDGTSAWLHDGADSWAVLSSAAAGPGAVHQGGPRRLGDELENAWLSWERSERPTPYDYGMTVRPDGQFVWLNDPDTGPRWPTVPGRRPVGADRG